MVDSRDSILVVEDDQAYAKVLERILGRRFDVSCADSREAAQEMLRNRVFHGVLLDIRLEGEASQDTDGISLLGEIKQDRPLMPVIMMTQYGSVELAVRAMKLGADDFVEKDEIDATSLARLLQESLRRNREKLQLQARAADQDERESFDLVGNAPVMQPVRRAIEMAASDVQAAVLIHGETGTGKEVVARSIHKLGDHRDGPFVAVPTPGLSPSLLESELFGHEKGAFTGADQQHIGYFERANGGVLFLDEIGDLALELQAKLLRVLDMRIINRVGSTASHVVDVQLVAATHRPLSELVSDGTFRQDLYYRLKTIEITVPPLRARSEDIPLLADHFLQNLRRQGRTKLKGFSVEAIETLKGHTFPGNVRELRAIVEWSILAARQAAHWVVEKEDLPAELQQPGDLVSSSPPTGDEPLNVENARARAELHCVNEALARCKGRKTEAEQLLGYPNRHTMRRRIQQLRERFPAIFDQFSEVKQAYGAESGAEL